MSGDNPINLKTRSPPMAENFSHRPRRVSFAIARNLGGDFAGGLSAKQK